MARKTIKPLNTDYKILLVSDSLDEIKDVSYILRKDFTKYISHCFENEALENLKNLKPDLVILAFKQIEYSERILEQIQRNCAPGSQPYLLLLCTQLESPAAYELYRQDHVDYFLADRPLVDPFTLITAVTHAFKHRSLRDELNHELGALNHFVMKMFDSGSQSFNGATGQIKALNENLSQELSQIQRNLLEAGEKGVLNAKLITSELARFQEDKLSSQAETVESLVNEQKTWLKELKTGYSEHLQEIELDPKNPEPVIVLLVDDDDFYRDTLSMMLGEFNLDIVGLDSAESAGSYLEKNTPGIIFLDYEMPGLSGVDFLKIVREEPRLQNVPIVMLTGHHTREIVVDSIHSGAADFIVKPGERDAIVHKIEQLTGRKVS